MVPKRLGIVVARIKHSGFLKSVLSLSSGVVIGQIINSIGMPIISRIYTAADLGDYTLITSSANVVIAVSVLGMMTVFMLPEKDTEARELSRLVSISTIIISFFCVLLFYLVSPWWRFIMAEAVSYTTALVVLWLYVVFAVVSNICYAYVNRLKLYRVLFWNPIIGATVNIILGIVFGILGWGFVGYTIAHIVSMLANIIHLITHANPFSFIPRIERQGYKKLLKSYQRFPKYQMPANLISSIAIQIPLEIMGICFSSTVLGYYSMTNRVMYMPITLLATPINRVYFQEASSRYQKGENISEFAFKIMETNIKLAMLPIIILMVFGRWIFSFVLGPQWSESGVYAAVLGIYFLVAFCISCLSGSFVIIGKSSWNLVCSIINVGIGVFLYLLVKEFPGITIWTFLVVMSFLFTLERVIEEGYFFVYMGLELKRYVLFVIKFIFIPFILSFAIQWTLELLSL